MSPQSSAWVLRTLLGASTVLVALSATGVVGEGTTAVVSLVLFAGWAAMFGALGAKRLGLIFLLMGTLGTVPAVSPERGTADFYSAVTQVIPVLLLVLALEVRFFRVTLPHVERREGESWFAAFGRVSEPDAILAPVVLTLTLSLLVLGELRSLSALASGHPETYPAEHVYTAVVVGLLVVCYLALFGGGDFDPAPPAGEA